MSLLASPRLSISLQAAGFRRRHFVLKISFLRYLLGCQSRIQDVTRGYDMERLAFWMLTEVLTFFIELLVMVANNPIREVIASWEIGPRCQAIPLLDVMAWNAIGEFRGNSLWRWRFESRSIHQGGCN